MSGSVLLVRHGETQWNLEGRCVGWTDVPLNETGLRQAAEVADHLADRDVAAIATSTLSRARMTADAIATKHELQPEPQDGLREIDHGLMEGVPFHHLPTHWPDQHRAWENGTASLEMPEGESVRQLQERALQAFDALTLPWLEAQREGKLDGDLVIVAHNLTIATIMCDVEGHTLDELRDHMLHNCGYHELVHQGGKWVRVSTWPERLPRDLPNTETEP